MHQNTTDISSTVSLNLTFAIELGTGKVMTPGQFQPIIESFLDDMKRAQETLIEHNADTLPYRENPKFGSKWARENVLEPDDSQVIPSSYVEKYWTLNGCKSEAARIILAWQQRVRVWDAIQELGNKASFDAVKAQLGGKWLDWRLYNNVASSKEKPARPVLHGVKFPFCQMNNQVIQQKTFLDGIVLHRVAIGDKRYDLFFDNQGIFERYPDITSLSRPTLLRMNSGEVKWHFSVNQSVEQPVVGHQDTVVAFDRNMDHSRIISGVRASRNGHVSGELGPSRNTVATVHHANRVKTDLERKKTKQANQMPWNVDSEKTARRGEDISLVSDALDALHDALDVLVADDMIGHLKPGEALVVERLDMFGGGPVKFRHGRTDERLEHKCARLGIPLVMVNPSGTTSSCPRCGGALIVRSGRGVYCPDCGFEDNRDTASSPVIAGRGLDDIVKAREKTVSVSSRVAGVRTRDKRRDVGRRYYERKVGRAALDAREREERSARRREARERKMERRRERGASVYPVGVGVCPSRPLLGVREGVSCQEGSLARVRALLVEKNQQCERACGGGFYELVAGFYRVHGLQAWATNTLCFEYGLLDTIRSFSAMIAGSPDGSSSDYCCIVNITDNQQEIAQKE